MYRWGKEALYDRDDPDGDVFDDPLSREITDHPHTMQDMILKEVFSDLLAEHRKNAQEGQAWDNERRNYDV